LQQSAVQMLGQEFMRGYIMQSIDMRPKLKPYSEIVKTAAELFNMNGLDAELEMDARLRKLAIPKIAVVLYVNWAGWNVLTYPELAEETGLTITAIKVHLQTVKRKFPYLFLGATSAKKR